MLSFGSFGFSGMFSSLFGSLQRSSPRELGNNYDAATSTDGLSTGFAASSFRIPEVNLALKFHKVHGKAIQLCDNATVAKRSERYFEHAVVFSHRPIGVGEIIAVEIVETSREFHGPMRIGLTSTNPSSLLNDGNVPLGRDLKNRAGFWLKSIHMFPLAVGTTVYFKLQANGTIVYGINGEASGVFLRDVDTSQQLWAVLEAYGTVQAVKFVKKTMTLSWDCGETEGVVDENAHPNSSTHRMTRSITRRRTTTQNQLSLCARRNVRITPLQKPNSALSSHLEAKSPEYLSAGPFEDPNFSAGVCIICTERERNTAFSKCGHVCMCYECAVEFKARPRAQGSSSSTRANRQLCPLCRKPIVSLLRIYS